jgi:agmatine deiminase
LWLDDLEPARREVAAMVKALSEGDRMIVLACGDEALHSAREALGLAAEVIPLDFGDIWLRDTGPVFSRNIEDQSLRAEIFKFNGWGEKYILPYDHRVAECVAGLAETPLRRHNFILEGGAIEVDGNGAIITTRQCLLNPNRNKGWTEAKAEAALADSYGARKVIWLDEGLLNDHTDGHVDNLARFVAPGRVVCQSPNGADDVNAAVLRKIEKTLRSASDADGKPLEIITIPSPGLVADEDGEAMAASHMNFMIGNKTVVVPIYNDAGESAVAALAKLFPAHKVVGLSARAILTGGGAFHCITQQEPA